MKSGFALLLLFASIPLYAQTNPGYPASMENMDMQVMMQAIQKMQACMSQVDQSELDALEARSNQMIAEVEALCKNNKRSQAQDRALSYAKEISDAEVLKEMQKCTEPMQGMMQDMVQTYSPELSIEELKNRHVCDGV